MALGLIKPTSGAISVLGETDAARVRSRIGFLPENLERATPLLEALRTVAADHGATPAQGALIPSSSPSLVERGAWR